MTALFNMGIAVGRQLDSLNSLIKELRGDSPLNNKEKL